MTCPQCGYEWQNKTGPRHIPNLDRKKTLGGYEELTEVQREILLQVYRYELMTLSQVGTLFSDAVRQRDRNDYASRQLAVLVRRGLVERYTTGNSRNRLTFFSLTDAGMYISISRENRRSIKRVRESKGRRLASSIFWRHHLATVDVAVAVARTPGGELVDWVRDGSLRYRVRGLGTTYNLWPDGRGVLLAKGQLHIFHVEVENHESSNEKVIEKVFKYCLFERSNGGNDYKRQLAVNRFPPCLFTAVRRSQLPLLRQAIVMGTFRSGYTLQEASKRLVFGLAALDDLKRMGAGGPVLEPVIQGLGKRVSFLDLHSLRS